MEAEKILSREVTPDSQKTVRVLLVEDDPDLIEIAEGLLELAGCTVGAAVYVPEEALDLLAENRNFDLLFTDYRFPSTIDGIGLADKVTSILPGIKVVIATGFDQQTIESQARQDYKVIYKPYRLEILKDLIQTLFPNSLAFEAKLFRG
jgi:CheY-like chemotaxis protein